MIDSSNKFTIPNLNPNIISIRFFRKRTTRIVLQDELDSTVCMLSDIIVDTGIC